MSQLFLPLVLWGTVHCVPLCELYPDRLRPNSAFFSPCHTAYSTWKRRSVRTWEGGWGSPTASVIAFGALGQGYYPGEEAASNQNPLCTGGSLQCRPNRSIPHYARSPGPVWLKRNAVSPRAAHRPCIPSCPGRTRDDRESGNDSQQWQPDQASVPQESAA